MQQTQFLARLLALCDQYDGKNRPKVDDLPGLTVYRRGTVSDIEATLYTPVICLILQGGKVTSTGDQSVALGPGDALLVSHDLPVMSHITKASVQEPYTALILSLDLGLVRSLYDQVSDVPCGHARALPLAAGPADPGWMEPLVRYLRMMDTPLDARVLGPLVRLEIHYRLLLSPIGTMLRHLLIADSHASRVGKAIVKLKSEFRSQLGVSDLADAAGMSASSFHKHFRSVTGTTPLQYQKDLRLIEARTLLIDRQHTVSQAAFAVGYESPTHFSRDYSRKFGLPPSRNVGDLTGRSAQARTASPM